MNSYRPPHIFNAVHRLRLFTLLDTHGHKQNFIITGQAAQGKSTLVASYLDSYHGKVLWFHLMKDHGDHAKLFDLLFQGIGEMENKNQEGNPADLPHTTLGTGKELLRHIEAISRMLQDVHHPLILVLDDFENLDENTSGFQMIKQLLDQRFNRLKIFILSRNIPPFHLPRVKMEENTIVLTNEDLAFTMAETRQFFSEKNNMKTGDLEKIQEITDGWAGGLTLVSQSLARFRDLSTLPHRLSRDVFSFFSREIHQSLTPSMRTFLMKTAVLDTIDPEAANHIAAPNNAVDMLCKLEKRNLFIQRIDSGGKWPEFKYHNLFREFLLKDLLETRGPNILHDLNRQIGLFYRDRNDHERAMDYFIRAAAYPEIAAIIKKKGTDYLIKQKMSRLKKWMHCLPAEITRKDPWLLFFLTMTRRIQGGKKNIRDLKTAMALFDEIKDIRGSLLSVGYLIEAAVFIRQPSRKILEWIAKGEALLHTVSRENRYPWARALLWQQMGLGYIAGDGNIPKGVSACKNAILMGRQIHNPDLVLNASITLTFGYVQAGDFVNARQMLSKIKNTTNEGGHPEYRALKSIVDIDFALKNGQFEMARDLLARSEADIEKFGLIFLYPGFVEAKALHLVYTDEVDNALRMADHLNDFSLLEGNDFYKGISHRIKALSYLRKGNYARAEENIHKALKELDQVKKGDIHYFLTQQLAGMIMFFNQNYEGAKKRLLPALDYFQKISSDLCFCETCLILGLIYWELNKREAAFHHLKQGYEKACREKYHFFPMLGNSLITKILVLVTAHGIMDPTAVYPRSLLTNKSPMQVFDVMDNILAQCPPPHRNKWLENLGTLHRQLLPRIRIETLGQFTVRCNDLILDPKIFGGSKPILLLKAIICHGSRDIPREILIDNLWPKATAAAGDKNFKINLHRLRKAIEPDPRKTFGHSYIHHKAGLISLDGALVFIDVDEFITMGAKGVEKERQEQYETALQYYDHAIKLYRGDYFAEEPYVEWMTRKRELFRERFMDLMQRKARLHEELNQINRAISSWLRILEVDPCFEAAYRNLMVLHADAGQKDKALKIFRQCRNILYEELSTEPAARTIRLYDQILSR